MKNIVLPALARSLSSVDATFLSAPAWLTHHYQQEFKWILEQARNVTPENASGFVIGGHSVLIEGESVFNLRRVPLDNENAAFIVKESQRIFLEAQEVCRLIAAVPMQDRSKMFGFKGDSPHSRVSPYEVSTFQKANFRTLNKMKEANVRALLRNLTPPFPFEDHMVDSEILGDKPSKPYKSLFGDS